MVVGSITLSSIFLYMSADYRIALNSKSGVYYNKEITVSLGSMLCKGHAWKWDIGKIGCIICKIITEFLSWMRTFFAYSIDNQRNW